MGVLSMMEEAGEQASDAPIRTNGGPSEVRNSCRKRKKNPKRDQQSLEIDMLNHLRARSGQRGDSRPSVRPLAITGS